MTGYNKNAKTGEVVYAPVRERWTATEFATKVKQVKDEVAALEKQLAGLPQVKDKPDEDTLGFYNSHLPMWRQPVENELEAKLRELAELEAVK